MNWTKEIPTVDGYYWVRNKYTGTEIETVKNSSLRVDGDWVSIDHLKSSGIACEFYGPLEEPK